MLNENQLSELKSAITCLLLSTQREGMPDLIDWLNRSGFFESPASSKYHGCYKGGLARHSLNVYELLCTKNARYQLGCDDNTMVISALLHDVCKVGAYIGNGQSYKWNRQQPKGHALLSLSRIADFMELTELESAMIRYHMGIYGSTAFEPDKGEYDVRGGGLAHAWFHYPIVKVMYFCDEFATFQEQAEEKETIE